MNNTRAKIYMILSSILCVGWAVVTYRGWQENPNDLFFNMCNTVATVAWAYCALLMAGRLRR